MGGRCPCVPLLGGAADISLQPASKQVQQISDVVERPMQSYGSVARSISPLHCTLPARPCNPLQVRMDNPDPVWQPIEVDIRQLCSADEQRPLKLQASRPGVE